MPKRGGITAGTKQSFPQTYPLAIFEFLIIPRAKHFDLQKGAHSGKVKLKTTTQGANSLLLSKPLFLEEGNSTTKTNEARQPTQQRLTNFLNKHYEQWSQVRETLLTKRTRWCHMNSTNACSISLSHAESHSARWFSVAHRPTGVSL